MNQAQLQQIVEAEIQKMLIKVLLVVIPAQLILTVALGFVANKLIQAQVEQVNQKIEQSIQRLEKQISEDLPEALEKKIQAAMQRTKDNLAPKLPKPDVIEIDGLRERLRLP